MREVVKLLKRRLAARLAVLLDRLAGVTELRREAARHICLDTLPVALELVDDELRHQKRETALMGKDANGNDQLLPVDRLGEIQPDRCISEQVEHLRVSTHSRSTQRVEAEA